MASEKRFATLISASHGVQHFLRRAFPPLIPIWIIAFNLPLAVAGIMLGAQSLGSAVGQAPFGVLSDRFDRRYILPTGIAFAALSVGAFPVIPFLPGLETSFIVADRTLDLQITLMTIIMFCIGFGGSVLHPTGYPLISANISEDRKGRVLGMWGSAAKLGDGFAPAIVGVLLLVLVWSDILLLVSVIGLGYAVLLFVALGDYETDPVETAARTAASSTGDDETGRVWDLDRRAYLYPILLIFAFFAVRMLAAGGVNVFIPEFIIREYDYAFVVADIEITAESTASFYYSALLITAGLVQLGTGRLVDVYDARLVIIGMLGIASLVLMILSYGVLSPIMLFAVLMLLGASLWAVEPARDALVSDITPADREGRTFGYLWTGALIVSSVSPVLIGYIGDIAGLRTAFALLALTTVLSTVPIALLLSKRVYVNIRELATTEPAD